MAKRVLILAGVLVLFGVFDAAAECVGCMYETCPTLNGGTRQAAKCLSQSVDEGYGIESCRNVLNCGGCMGWSCYRQGDVPLSELVPTSLTIEVMTKRDIAEPTECADSAS
jgi:hypothetical protein